MTERHILQSDKKQQKITHDASSYRNTTERPLKSNNGIINI
nr:MAG TPA: hypothetical protein [Caudoviricetes sp.]